MKNESSQFSAEKDTNVSILKFTLGLTFYMVNSLVGGPDDPPGIKCGSEIAWYKKG